MKKTNMLFVLALVCVGVRAQTLLSRSYDVSPVISYTVFEPQKDTVYDDTIDGNEVTTGKIEGFLFIPSTEGVTIENKKGCLPSSAFYTYKSLADVAKGGFDEIKRKKQHRQFVFE